MKDVIFIKAYVNLNDEETIKLQNSINTIKSAINKIEE